MAILFIVIRVLIGLLFLGAGFAKLAGAPPLVQEFATIGVGQWFRYLTGVLEIGGALLLVPVRTVSLGAGLLTCVALGALVAQLAILHGDPIHTIVIAALAGAVAWHYRDRLALRRG